MECEECSHSAALHDENGCHTPGCSCRMLRLPVQSTDDPVCPGACVHIAGDHGMPHVIQSVEAVRELAESTDEFVHLDGLQFWNRRQYTIDIWVRPQHIMNFHSIIRDQWEKEIASIG